ncbi:MAG: serine hydrolase [Flavobacteriales bacterium]|nr:serine hydrolase [Flavobacteriales bacterium]
MLKKVLLVLVSLIILAVAALLITGNQHVLNGIGKTYLIGKNKPDINDFGHFEMREMKNGEHEAWAKHRLFGNTGLNSAQESYHDSMQSASFLVIHRDSLLFEKYWRGFDEKSRTNCFSMAKSFTSILVGVAIEEGYIKSVNQKVSEFIPAFGDGKNADLTIKHLLQMASGIPFGESYSSPFGYMARAYYGKNLIEETLKYNVEYSPGSKWIYEGGNTVLIAMVIQKVTGRSLSQYFEEKVWSCIGAEQSAFWALDKKDGFEKAYSAVYASARDYARIGSLYMHNGIWKNDTLVPPSYVAESLVANQIPDSFGDNCSWYGYHWWLGNYNGKKIFSARGLRGQYIIVVPEDELIVVRTGHQQNKERQDHMPTDMFRYIDDAIQMAGLTEVN